MKFRLAVSAVVAVITLDACQPSGNAAPAALGDADRAALTALLDSAVAQVKTRRLDVWAAAFTDDAVFLPPNHPMVRGRAAIHAWADSFPPLTDFAFPNIVIAGAGNIAWGTTSIPMSFTPPGGPLVRDTAKQLIVWNRQPDEAWKTVAVAFSSDLPAMPAPAPLPAPPAKK